MVLGGGGVRSGCSRGAEIPRTTDESLRSNEKYYQAMKYAVDNSGMSRGLYTTEENASGYRDAVRVVIKSNHPKRSKIIDLLLLANIYRISNVAPGRGITCLDRR